MAKLCNSTSMIVCSQALLPTPVPFTATPVPTAAVEFAAGTVMDFAPVINIPTFGMCNSATDPAVILATAAAQGVHTPAPCMPKTAAPWSPGSETVTIGGQKALLDSDTCKCTSNGQVSFKISMAPTVEIGS